MNVCVTGTIGAGKSRVVTVLAKHLDCPVISADVIAKDLMQVGEKGYASFVSTYGDQYLGANDEIDRRALRKAISQTPKIKNQLEDILHPLIENELTVQIQEVNKNNQICLYEIPLLFEVAWQDNFDLCVSVFVRYKEGKKRLMSRDGLDQEFAESLLKLHYSSFTKAMMADVVFDNSGSFAQTYFQILQFVSYIRSIRS